jgi:hypothetical protein
MEGLCDGDVLLTTCANLRIPCWHPAIILIENGAAYAYNNTPVATNSFGGNVVRQPLDEFLKNRRILRLVKADLDADFVREYSYGLRFERWNAASFNCEDYVNEVMTGQRYSELRNNYIVAGLVAMALVI